MRIGWIFLDSDTFLKDNSLLFIWNPQSKAFIMTHKLFSQKILLNILKFEFQGMHFKLLMMLQSLWFILLD